MDRKFKVGDKVRFKTREQIKEIAIKKYEEWIDGKLNGFEYELPSHISFNDEMEHLCGTEATITHINGCRIELANFKPLKDVDYDWIYTDDMVELVEEDKPQYKQMSFESLDELRDKMENFNPDKEISKLELKTIEKLYESCKKDYELSCKEFEEMKTSFEEMLKHFSDSIKSCKEYIAEVDKDEPLK